MPNAASGELLAGPALSRVCRSMSGETPPSHLPTCGMAENYVGEVVGFRRDPEEDLGAGQITILELLKSQVKEVDSYLSVFFACTRLASLKMLGRKRMISIGACP